MRVQLSYDMSDWLDKICGVPQGLILGPLLFLFIYIDQPKVAKHTQLFLFADDTDVTALNQRNENIEDDLMAISNWLIASKLVVNFDETSKMNIGSGASSLSEYLHVICNSVISCNPGCKYLRITLDREFSFQTSNL